MNQPKEVPLVFYTLRETGIEFLLTTTTTKTLLIVKQILLVSTFEKLYKSMENYAC